uniref:Uncharacterized protein n=1 Tax=Chelonoidis abingdonii TaxID=106734 RepID=A0A8C0H9Z5_CHEAB
MLAFGKPMLLASIARSFSNRHFSQAAPGTSEMAHINICQATSLAPVALASKLSFAGLPTKNSKKLNFLIKETMCLVSEKAVMEQCNFKGDGLARDYSGYIFPEQQLAINLITCDTVAEEVRKVSAQVTSRGTCMVIIGAWQSQGVLI